MLMLPERSLAGPPGAGATGPGPAGSGPDGLRRRLADALDEAALFDDADPAGAAVARVVAVSGAGQVALDAALEAAVARLAAAPEAGASWDRVLWDAAADAVAQERLAEAVILLAALAVAPGGRAEGLLGLAVCAARLAVYEEARILALASRDDGPGHPRALYVAGLCALEQGDRRAAQSFLATAARIARRRAEFREDARLAQRLLLIMHIA